MAASECGSLNFRSFQVRANICIQLGCVLISSLEYVVQSRRVSVCMHYDREHGVASFVSCNFLGYFLQGS